MSFRWRVCHSVGDRIGSRSAIGSDRIGSTSRIGSAIGSTIGLDRLGDRLEGRGSRASMGNSLGILWYFFENSLRAAGQKNGRLCKGKG
jgi:hypothetical protein